MSSTGKLHGCRVLVIEDEYFLANDIEEALKSHGARIIGPYAELEAACRRAEQDHFDVAVVDVNLRNKKAWPVADELVRQGIPFIFCTGYNATVIPERFADVSVWQKPIDVLKIVEDIELLCRMEHDDGRR
ncbi:response regulator [Bradyrhizobium japonicum]|uniref:response regulator n=1 Tax=Bradyrhizobium japonicum TaxID=375 RepID=UPI001BA92FAC|nr:response regulator [Bradyrhizobium japonicum]MBR0760710.1 response regulator [Bradyrhizobium japonicum]